MNSRPIAYLITWTTYATWLRGDERGWTEPNAGLRSSDAMKALADYDRLSEQPFVLSPFQRDQVAAQIRETCNYRGWTLHAVNARTNHVHVVVTAPQTAEAVREQLKAWATRRLKTLPETGNRERFWTEGGDVRLIDDEAGLADATDYVVNQQ